jgi:hypothetical protein
MKWLEKTRQANPTNSAIDTLIFMKFYGSQDLVLCALHSDSATQVNLLTEVCTLRKAAENDGGQTSRSRSIPRQRQHIRRNEVSEQKHADQDQNCNKPHLPVPFHIILRLLRPAFCWLLLGQGLLYKIFPGEAFFLGSFEVFTAFFLLLTSLNILLLCNWGPCTSTAFPKPLSRQGSFAPHHSSCDCST